MLLFNKRLFVLLFMLFAVTVKAQQLTAPIGLKQLLIHVDQNAPSLITDSSAIKIRQNQANEVQNNWLPNLKLNYQADVGTSNNVVGPYFGFGIIPSSSGGVHSTNVTTALSTNLGVAALDWEIYNFGAYRAQNKVARSDIQVEQSNFAESKYQVEAFAINNYLRLLSLQNYLSIQSRNIQRNQEILRSISSLTKSGVRPGVDTSIANAELSKARLNYIELNDQFIQIQLQLSAISGLPYRAIVADTTLAAQLSGMHIQQIVTDTLNHPLINYYQSVYLNSKQREELVKKQFNPKISLEAAAWARGSSVDADNNFNSLSSGFGFERNNYLVGFGVSYNLFDLRRRQLKLSTQRSETDYARNKLEEQKIQLMASAKEADAEIQTARQRLAEIPNQIKAANDSYRQQLSLYKNGLSNIIDLDAALNLLYRAETDYAQAKYDYNNSLFGQAVTLNQVSAILNLLK